MRDGVRLSTTVVRPKGANGKLSAILVRAPYDDTARLFGAWLYLDFFVKQGFAVVEQDERGRGFSEGRYENYLQGARTDGYDSVAWIVKQPWSNGKVAGIGFSSAGENQWLMAADNPPGLAAIIPAATWAVGNVPGNFTQGAFYRGGVPSLAEACWYPTSGVSERLVLPSDTNQDERIRLRSSYSHSFLFAQSACGNSLAELMRLPSKDLVRQFGGALTPFNQYITWSPGDSRWTRLD